MHQVRERTGPTAGALALLLALPLAACAGGPTNADAAAPPGPSRPVVPAALLPTFEALEQAIEAGDEDSARQLLARIRTRSRDPDVLEAAATYERILVGRALADRLDLRLECRELAEAPGTYVARFVATQTGPDDVVLRTAPARLRLWMTTVDVDGDEQRAVRTFAVERLSEIPVPAHGSFELDVGAAELPVGRFLAVRGSWQLELFAGSIHVGSTDAVGYPAMDVPVARCEAVRLGPFLPQEPVEPAELVRYVATPGFDLPPALERTVRIPGDRREEALDGLTAVAADMNLPDLTRLVPCLRWLSGAAGPGGDPEAWRRWLTARGSRRAAADRADLALPGSP